MTRSRNAIPTVVPPVAAKVESAPRAGVSATQDADRAAQEPAADSQPPLSGPVTYRTIQKYVARGERFACLTCYDATTARWLQRAGVPVLLVGDTAGEVILGLPGTIHAPLEFMYMITAAVKRGAPNCHVMADMPFLSYQADEGDAIRNAGRFLTDGLADSVKLELDRSFAPLIERMARAGIPVVAHIGCRPQHVKRRGGYGSVGRTAREAREMVADAAALEDAGAAMILIEATPNEVSQRIVEKAGIPVIGCGAGAACHGQIVVLQDLLGLTDWQPSFAPPITAMGGDLIAAAERWIQKVRASDLGEHPYRMTPDEMSRFTQGG